MAAWLPGVCPPLLVFSLCGVFSSDVDFTMMLCCLSYYFFFLLILCVNPIHCMFCDCSPSSGAALLNDWLVEFSLVVLQQVAFPYIA